MFKMIKYIVKELILCYTITEFACLFMQNGLKNTYRNEKTQ